jgi:ATP-dependent Clp protease, protease subunit
MPLGIPKVTYSRFTDDKPTWIGIYERLYKERALFLCKEITTSFATRFIGLLLQLDSETDLYDDTDDDNDISIYINSFGGGAEAAISIYDTMKYIVPDVSTINLGLAESAASLILAGGTITKRLTLPNAKVMIHQPTNARSKIKKKKKDIIKKKPSFIKMELEHMRELRNTIADIYAENTGKPVDVIQKDLERDYFMSATEARDYGIIDRIIESKKENAIKPE